MTWGIVLSRVPIFLIDFVWTRFDLAERIDAGELRFRPGVDTQFVQTVDE